MILFNTLKYLFQQKCVLNALTTTTISRRRQKVVACSQFHQHFMSSFCANILLLKKLQSQTLIREKLRKALLNKKGARKMLMKLNHA